MSIAVITGASSGIGREFAYQLDEYGLEELWLIARSEDNLKEVAAELKTKTRVLAYDLTKNEDIERYGSLLMEVGASIMYLINDSGYGKLGSFEEISDLDEEGMIELNIKGLVKMSKLSIPYITEGGAIINISSSSSFNPLPYFNVYAASKAFVYHYSRGLREEIKERGIGVTAVCPGWVLTNFLAVAEVGSTSNAPKKFKPIYQSKEVVKKALKDANNDKAVSIYGIHTKLHRLASKLLPDTLLIKTWLNMCKKSH